MFCQLQEPSSYLSQYFKNGNSKLGSVKISLTGGEERRFVEEWVDRAKGCFQASGLSIYLSG